MKFKPTPRKLDRDTIVEAIYEVRFDSALENASDVLPGLMYSKLRNRYGNVLPLPILQLPQALREQDPGLKYQATHRLDSGDGRALLIGNHVLAVSVVRHYPGWDTFKPVIEESLKALNEVAVVSKLIRTSIKYVNCVPTTHVPRDLEALDLQLTVGGITPQDGGFSLRFEHRADDLISIVEIQPKAEALVRSTSEVVKGILLAVDVICENPPDNLLDMPSPTLNAIHQREKDMFFAVLTKETAATLGPVWK